MLTIENAQLRAVIAPKGAELQSLFNKQTGIEHLWNADPNYWGKYSPVLFPIVGGLKNNTYYYQDKVYQLPRHGFARDMTFEAEQISTVEVLFTLSQSEETLVVYPFAFELKLRYRLEGAALICQYEVCNPAEADLLFSIGAHPAFAVPMAAGGNYTDYYLQWNKVENLVQWQLADDLISTDTIPLVLTKGRLALSKALFQQDAIVLKNLQSDCLTLGSNTHSHGLHFHFSDFPFFGIWAARDADFVCLEPWCGIADSVDHNQQLASKEGIIVLPAGQHFQRHWKVVCF